MKLKDKEKITDSLEDLHFKVGMIVEIKKDAIKNGLLKTKCKQLMGKKGIIRKANAVVTDDSEVEISWEYGYNLWIMPKESLEIIGKL